jgi:hypothetical protein
MGTAADRSEAVGAHGDHLGQHHPGASQVLGVDPGAQRRVQLAHDPDDGSTVGLPRRTQHHVQPAAVEEVAFGRGQTTGREPVCDLAGGLASHAERVAEPADGDRSGEEEPKHRGVAAAVVVKAAAGEPGCHLPDPRTSGQCERITEELGGWTAL